MAPSPRLLLALAALVLSVPAARSQRADSVRAVARPASSRVAPVADGPHGQAVALAGIGPSHRLGLVADAFVGGETARWGAGLRIVQELRILRASGFLLLLPSETETTEAAMLYGARIHRDGSSRSTLGVGVGLVTVRHWTSGERFGEPSEPARTTVRHAPGAVLTAEQRVRLIRIGRVYGFHLRVAPVVVVSPRSTFATLTLGAAHVITLR